MEPMGFRECPRFGKWFGCEFEPRYDTGGIDWPERMTRVEGLETVKLLQKRVYVRDVCVRCGKAIERVPGK